MDGVDPEALKALQDLSVIYTERYLDLYHPEVIDSTKEVIKKYHLDIIGNIVENIYNERITLKFRWEF